MVVGICVGIFIQIGPVETIVCGTEIMKLGEISVGTADL